MAYPEGVQTSTLTFSNPITFLGNDATRTEITVQATSSLVWSATGQPIDDFAELVNPGEGMPGSLTVPFVDQPGFTDQTGNAFTMWAYIVTRRTFFGSSMKTVKKNWQPLIGQDVIDFDNLPGGQISLPVAVPVAAVTSVAGRTGVIGAQPLADALAEYLPAPELTTEAIDAALPARLSEEELAAAIAGAVTPEAVEENLPARLSEEAQNATIDDQGAASVGNTGSGWWNALIGWLKDIFVDKSQLGLNILDYGVIRGTAASQTAAIKAALDANPDEEFYFPRGKYRLDTGLVVSKGNVLNLAHGAHIYAGASMDTLITYMWDGAGYAEDRALTGGLLDGALKANRILSIGKVIMFTLENTRFRDGINRGLVTESGLGAELIASKLRFYNTTSTNVADNVAIEAKMGDSHFRDIIIRDWTVAVKDTAANRWDRVHPWIGPDMGAGKTQMTSRYPTSVSFDLTGASDLQGCMADTYRTGFKFRTNGTSYTAPARLRNCRVAWADQPTLPQAVIDMNQAYVFDNTDGVGVDCANHSIKGHNTGTPAQYLTGPSTLLNIRNTHSHGFVTGAQGTTGDSFDYRGGVQQGTFLFTPTLIGSTSTTNAHTYTTQSGRMVVTGDTVTYYVHIEATTDAAGTFAGSLRIGGIPLPYTATGVRTAAGSVGYSVNVNASGALIFANTAPYITLMTMDAAGQSEVSVGVQALRGKAVKLVVAVAVPYYKS